MRQQATPNIFHRPVKRPQQQPMTQQQQQPKFNYVQDTPYGQYTGQIREPFKEILLINSIHVLGDNNNFSLQLPVSESDFVNNYSGFSINVPASMRKLILKVCTKDNSAKQITGIHSATFMVPANNGQYMPSARQEPLHFKPGSNSALWEVECLLGELINSFEIIVSTGAPSGGGEVESSHSLCVFVSRA